MRALARTFTGGVRAFVSRTARALARFLDTPAVAAAEPAPFSMTFPARTRPQGGAATHMGPLEPESEEHNAETAGAKWYGSPTEIGIAQKMVRDAHVRKSLEYIRAPIAAATWDFQAPEKTALAAEIADFCRYNFFALNDWRRVVRDGFLYLRDGFSLLELVEAVERKALASALAAKLGLDETHGARHLAGHRRRVVAGRVHVHKATRRDRFGVFIDGLQVAGAALGHGAQ